MKISFLLFVTLGVAIADQIFEPYFRDQEGRPISQCSPGIPCEEPQIGPHAIGGRSRRWTAEAEADEE